MGFRSAAPRRGSALVIVLGMLSVLLLMGVAFSVTMRTERAGASNMRHADMARHILDSALMRTISDLDTALHVGPDGKKNTKRDNDLPVPTNLVVVVSTNSSNSASDRRSVNLLSHEASRHLPADQLLAALYAKAEWLPIYGGARIVHDNDPTMEDPPVGRYAYVVLNGCGFLDPNIVASTNRGFGTDAREIQIGDDNGRFLGLSDLDTDSANDFVDQRDYDGHYVTMRDLLRTNDMVKIIFPSKWKTGWEPNFNTGVSIPAYFYTNVFSIGGMSLEGLAPALEADQSGSSDSPIRFPKCALVDPKTGEAFDPSTVEDLDTWVQNVLDAVNFSFQNTWAQQSGKREALPERITDPQTKRSLDFDHFAARNILEMLDSDFTPGKCHNLDSNSDGNKLSEVGTSNDGAYDVYLKAMGDNWRWDRLPCVEPAPLLDNIFIAGGSYGKDSEGSEDRFTFERDRSGDTYDVVGGVTNGLKTARWWVTLSLRSNPVYPGWNLPEKAEGTFTYAWKLVGIDVEEKDGINNAEFKKALKEGINSVNFDQLKPTPISLKMSQGDVSPDSKKGKRFDQPDDYNVGWAGNQNEYPELVRFSIDVPKKTGKSEQETASNGCYDNIPDSFGLTLHVIGYIGRGDHNSFDNNILQVVPFQWEALNANCASKNEGSVIDVDLILKKDQLIKEFSNGYNGCDGEGKNEAGSGKASFAEKNALGWAYCLDPRFGYLKGSWISSPSINLDDNSADGKFRKTVVKNHSSDADQGNLNDLMNPVTEAYLRDAREKYGDKNLYQYFSDDYGNECGLYYGVVGGVSDEMWSNPQPLSDQFFGFSSYGVMEIQKKALSFHFDRRANPANSPFAFTRVAQLGLVPIGTFRTIALYDGFYNVDSTSESALQDKVGIRQRVLDFFTMDPTGTVHRGQVNLNLPRTVRWKTNSDGDWELSADQYNTLPLTAALNGCPLLEWLNSTSNNKLDWDQAAELAEAFANTLKRTDNDASKPNRTGDIEDWNARGVAHDLSILGRASKEHSEIAGSWDAVLRDSTFFPKSCDFEREGVIRNSAGLFTTRQQLFTILIKADSFTPKFGFSDVEHGTSLASVQAIAHIWRDPEPLRDKDGEPILDINDNPIHPWVLLDMYQF